MNILLLFFALPIAVIIISIALEKIFKNPFLVAAIIFAVFLVVTFIISDTTTFLIATIVYTILSFITSVITKIMFKIIHKLEETEGTGNTYNQTNISNTIDKISNSDEIISNSIDKDVDTFYRCYRRR